MTSESIQVARLRVEVAEWYRQMDGGGHESVNQEFWKGTALAVNVEFHINGLDIQISGFRSLDSGRFDEPQTPGEGTRPTAILVFAGPVPPPGGSGLLHGIRSHEFVGRYFACCARFCGPHCLDYRKYRTMCRFSAFSAQCNLLIFSLLWH